MPTAAMKRLFVVESESSSSSSASFGVRGAGRREAEPAAAVLCAPRPLRVYPSSADLILDPPAFLLASDSTSSSNTTKMEKEGKSKSPEEGEEDGDGSWAAFDGSPPARAGNPLVNDPHFLLNQRRRHAAAAAPDHSPALFDLAVFDDHGRDHPSHHPTYSNINSSFAPSFAPAVRIQGFDVAGCRSSHSSGGGRVLSARA